MPEPAAVLADGARGLARPAALLLKRWAARGKGFGGHPNALAPAACGISVCGQRKRVGAWPGPGGLLLAAALASSACAGVQLPFLATPTPPPTPVAVATPSPTPTPTPTPTPRPAVEVKQVQVAIVDRSALSVAVAFLLRNPNAGEFLLGGVASGAFSTPDGRAIPQARPNALVDLAPSEEKWFAFPSVDTFGSVVGKVDVAVVGGQWIAASAYPYPGGVPTTVVRGDEPAKFVVKNNGDLGANANVRAFAYNANDVFVGLVECPQRLFPARLEVTITCGAANPDTLKAPKLVFATYADLRPVLILPTPSPTPTASPTGR